MYKKFFCNFYISTNEILFKQIVHFVRILVAEPVCYSRNLMTRCP